MRGETLITIEEKHSEMRCLDKYGNRPERDGALLIGILVGKDILYLLLIIYAQFTTKPKYESCYGHNC